MSRMIIPPRRRGSIVDLDRPRRNQRKEQGRTGPGTLRLWMLVAFAAGGLAYGQFHPSATLQPSAPHRQDSMPTAAIAAAPGVTAPFSLCGAGPRVNCVVDGDTLYLGGRKIRLADIDTPEIFSPRCAAEKALGERATLRLVALLNAGDVSVTNIARDTDRYGRSLRTLARDGRSVGETLVAEGLARRWDGARRSWCG